MFDTLSSWASRFPLPQVSICAQKCTNLSLTELKPMLFFRGQVKCSSCGFTSDTYDPFLDLSLEINRADSLERALKRFTTVEVLDGDNRYKCSK